MVGKQNHILSNARDLQGEIEWLRDILRVRSALNAQQETDYADVLDIPPPDLSHSNSRYAHFVRDNTLGFAERFLLILAAIPHIKPELLDVFIQKNSATQRIFTEFGGKIGQDHAGFLPTGETVMFVLAGDDLERRFALLRCFDRDHFFVRSKSLWLAEPARGEPQLNGQLLISPDLLDLITRGVWSKPNFGSDFPARYISTPLEWPDLVLEPATRTQIDEIETWLAHKETLLDDWGMKRVLKPGYKVLFHGPPGTGKTLTAMLLAKKMVLDIYRVDLSQMVSKYIGETEKNLAKVFDKAEHKNWILFFDEGDALFGKRTSTKDAHDRYANQQVSYLLQRIEEYDGLVILATNLKNNIDDAFLRRFQSIIHFPMPGPGERRQLWQRGFPTQCTLDEAVDLPGIAQRYELAGGPIINVVQYCALMALKRGDHTIRMEDILRGIKKELRKNGRTL